MVGGAGVGSNTSQGVEVNLGKEETADADEKDSVEVGKDEDRVEGHETAVAEQVEVEAAPFLPGHLIPLVDNEHQPGL